MIEKSIVVLGFFVRMQIKPIKLQVINIKYPIRFDIKRVKINNKIVET